ncbi:MAG: exodeoxyribonuclease VII large subunit [Pseudomonadales bacterium]
MSSSSSGAPAGAPGGTAATPRPVLSVSAFAREARLLLEEHFHIVWVEGELSNFRVPGSGHWYFTLKDDQAQVRCAMFAGRNRSVRFVPRDGTQVLVRGRVSLYEPRGDFQLIVESMEPAGEGALRAAFEALKQRLDAEGLFDPARKRALPAIPRRLVVISSASGAALRDVLHVIERRFPAMDVVLLPVAVQGERAEPEVLAALARVASLDADVVLLTRGGGSLEDLWTFNLESVARSIAACPVPVVSAVGHQTDFTIADFVADLRAPTPSAGAELITPDRDALETQLGVALRRLTRALEGQLAARRWQLRHLRGALTDPRRQLQQRMQRTDELDERLRLALRQRLRAATAALATQRRALALVRPDRTIRARRERLAALAGGLRAATRRVLAGRAQDLAAMARTLQAVSPLATLDRGYAVLTRSDDAGRREAVTSIAATGPGQTLTAHLRDGALIVNVESVDEDNQLPRLPEP